MLEVSRRVLDFLMRWFLYVRYLFHVYHHIKLCERAVDGVFQKHNSDDESFKEGSYQVWLRSDKNCKRSSVFKIFTILANFWPIANKSTIMTRDHLSKIPTKFG